MKKHLISALICFQVLGAVRADETLRLSQEDAKQLHAFLLTGELLDFGDRTRSASAYLMAAELMLDYPTGPVSKEKVVELCQQARKLINDDEFLLSWANRLELRVVKSSRGVASDFVTSQGVLEAGEARIIRGSYDAGWIDSSTAELRLVDEQGDVLQRGSEVFAGGLRTDSYRWCVINVGGVEAKYRLLLRRPLAEGKKKTP